MKKRPTLTHNNRPAFWPGRAGTPWSDKEDRQLREEHAQGLTIAQMAEAHLRTKVGIEVRLTVLNNKPENT
jgi:hypothetical protein